MWAGRASRVGGSHPRPPHEPRPAVLMLHEWGHDAIGSRRRLMDGGLTPRALRGARRSPTQGAAVSVAADQLRSITRAGHERLSAQLAELVTVRRPEVLRWSRDARGDGATDDNPDHTAALETYALLERRIAALRHTLARAEIIDSAPQDTAGIGTTVQLRMPNGRTTRYQLVGAAEAHPQEQRISIESPVGQAIFGRRPGDVVAVRAPGGTRRVEILSIGPLPAARRVA